MIRRGTNPNIDEQPQVVLLDWALVGRAPPGSDLAWYLALNSARLPVSKECRIEVYRSSLAKLLGARFSIPSWQPQLELCLLATFVQFGWEKALGAAQGDSAEVRDREIQELRWWSERARVGMLHM
jgi:hypothetical protein